MHEPEGYECPFCRIAAGHQARRVVHRTDDVMVLVNIKWWPNNPGGLLVVPVEHHENVYELPPALGTPLQRAIRDAALALKSAFGCDGVSTRQHNEPAGNQDVWHHHTHVFPRYHGDDLYRSRGAMVPTEEVDRMAALLRQHWPAVEDQSDLAVTVAGKPAAAGCLLYDDAGRILVVEPTYRDTWGIPGGALEPGESPLDGLRREVLEELGLAVEIGPLLAVDHRRAVDSIRFVFDGPILAAEEIAAIALPADELRSFRFVELDEATRLLQPDLARRIRTALDHRGAGAAVYLEDGALAAPTQPQPSPPA